MTTPSSQSTKKTHYDIPAFHRLTFSVDTDTTIRIKLSTGTAELFGTELLMGKEYQLTGFLQSMIFTWQGARVSITGETRTAAVRDTRTHMEQILSIHEDLQERRMNPRIESQISTEMAVGPRVLICGESNTGKTSVARILLSYATRMKHDILFADLDIEGGLLSMPSTIAGSELSLPVAIESELQYAPIPIMYLVGNTDITKDEVNVYDRAMDRLSERINKKFLSSSEKKALALREQMKVRTENEIKPHGGVIVDTWSLDGQFKGPSYDAVCKAVSAFNINYMIVNGGEDYYDHFTDKFPHVKVVRLDRFPGASSREKMETGHVRRKIRDYFYGAGSAIKLLPHTMHIKLDQLKFCRVKSRYVPKGSLPINQEDQQTIDKCQVEIIQPGGEYAFLHNLFAVSAATTEEEITTKNIYGFVYVTKLNMEKKVISVLEPLIGPLLSPILLRCNLGDDAQL